MKKKLALVAIHEIYGVNDHMHHVIDRFTTSHIDVFCPNLLQLQNAFHYSDEEKAYQYFMNQIGFDDGKEQIEEFITCLSNSYTHIGLIGFSVGATISWLCNNNPRIDFIIGCYGSRIRDYVHIKPTCATLLIFPEQEASFSVSSLMKALQQQNNPLLEINQLHGEHGFLNPYTEKYNEHSTKQAYNLIDSFLTQTI
ncbi:dienelactone hydrolase family protein [Bacillus mycoides]|uniref:dienelactone hydrolase family protein n=1 Tax=Bacillus mycoides TaxID=1405 RepID=UPI0028535A69|nr:dienelactone hydrolase family protein [Bacillus mycoides]MDR4901132.1 dienelactone hydrolase family protein [Bacillus mycoides]MED1010537.1 dienelactone hydrolase family protein [Bacillus mycoides]MED1048016.1 dienelactone hydrolase family protein [Bacillus mycoides]MED1050243.1 dienelactone hydrolase family protein [Bacillus mycoides]MED1084084.1 dienelactone hydrolase family protein [Bacillus mycoides]